MSHITAANIVAKLESAAHNAWARGFNGDLYQAAAERIRALEYALSETQRLRDVKVEADR